MVEPEQKVIIAGFGTVEVVAEQKYRVVINRDASNKLPSDEPARTEAIRSKIRDECGEYCPVINALDKMYKKQAEELEKQYKARKEKLQGQNILLDDATRGTLDVQIGE